MSIKRKSPKPAIEEKWKDLNGFAVGDNTTNNSSESIAFPLVKRVAAQTLASDLVTVQPIGGVSKELMERIEKEVKVENRDRKIEAIVEDSEYKEMKLEEHPEWKGPSAKLFYLDYQYGNSY